MQPTENKKRVYDNTMLRYQTKWLHLSRESPATQADRNPIYLYMNAILAILFTMLVLTATPRRSYSMMCKVKTYLHATMKTERLSALVLLHAYREMTTDRQAIMPMSFAPRRMCQVE